MYEVYVCKAVKTGLEDSKAGRITEAGKLQKESGLLE